MYSDEEMADLIVGATVTALHLSEYRLTLETDRGMVTLTAEAECCSISYFHDLIGVRHLLDNGPITAFEPIELAPGDVGYHDPWCQHFDCEGVAPCGQAHPQEYLAVYGYRFTTEHRRFGPVSTVVAFRNASNGYYGGWLSAIESGRIYPDQISVTADVVGKEWDQ